MSGWLLSMDRYGGGGDRPTVKINEGILVDVFKRLRSLQPNMDAHGAMQPCFVHFEPMQNNGPGRPRKQFRVNAKIGGHYE
ncbi:MAG: hypothetical protein HRU33_19345 [Rhodobacteraceae bacterium]|nr:hypothetical protein [Paracoccaceae bacterium]